MKFNLTTRVIKFGTILVPTLSASGGYLYCWVLLKQFGINASTYFSLTDYASVSLDIITWAFLYVTILLGIFVWYSKLSNSNDIKDAFKIDYKLKFCTGLILLISFGSMTIITFQAGDLAFAALNFAAFTFTVLPYLFYFFKLKNNLAFTAAYCFIMFLIVTSSFSLHKSQLIMSEKVKPVNIAFRTNSISKSQTEMILILKNSQYYFMYNGREKKVFIIPERNVQGLSIKL